MTQAQKWHLSLPCTFNWLKLFYVTIPNYREKAQNTNMVYRVPQKKKKALWRLLGSLRHIYLAVLFQNQDRCSRKVLATNSLWSTISRSLVCLKYVQLQISRVVLGLKHNSLTVLTWYHHFIITGYQKTYSVAASLKC